MVCLETGVPQHECTLRSNGDLTIGRIDSVALDVGTEAVEHTRLGDIIAVGRTASAQINERSGIIALDLHLTGIKHVCLAGREPSLGSSLP